MSVTQKKDYKLLPRMSFKLGRRSCGKPISSFFCTLVASSAIRFYMSKRALYRVDRREVKLLHTGFYEYLALLHPAKDLAKVGARSCRPTSDTKY